MQTARRFVPVMIASMVIAACGLLHRSDPNAPCPVPPAVSLARWTPTNNSGVIEGTVMRVESLRDTAPKPLDQARVFISGPVQRSADVDSAGGFRLADLPLGQYLVGVRKVGYPPRNDSLRIGPGGLTGVIRLSQTPIALFANCCHSQICL